MRVFADARGRLLALYRSARETVHRDIYLLASADQGKTFESKRIHEWEIGACPMSSMSFSEGPSGVLGAWETAQQVYFARIDSKALAVNELRAAPGAGDHRKHPRLAQNARGEVLLAWAVVKGWGKGGEFQWQVFGRDGKALGEVGSVGDLPPWSFGAALVDS